MIHDLIRMYLDLNFDHTPFKLEMFWIIWILKHIFKVPFALTDQCPRGDYLTYFLLRVLVTKNIEKGPDFGLVALTTFLEKGYLFHINLWCQGPYFNWILTLRLIFFGLIVARFLKGFYIIIVWIVIT